MSHEARFAALGLQLPPAPKPLGVYKPIVVVGDSPISPATDRCSGRHAIGRMRGERR